MFLKYYCNTVCHLVYIVQWRIDGWVHICYQIHTLFKLVSRHQIFINSFNISFKNNAPYSTLNKVICDKQILPSVKFKLTTSFVRCKHLPLDHEVWVACRRSWCWIQLRAKIVFHILLYLKWNVKNCFVKLLVF